MTFAWQTPAYWRRYERHAKQRRAAYLLSQAIKKGDLVRGQCSRRGADCHGAIHGHHADYDKPLEVIWLCSRHHRQLHTAERRAIAARINAEPDAIPAKATPGSTKSGG